MVKDTMTVRPMSPDSVAQSPDNMFRKQIRETLESILPDDLKGTMDSVHTATRDGLTRWQRLLDDKDLWLIGWPEKWGGVTLTSSQEHILEQELLQAGAPMSDIMAKKMIGPIILQFGSDQLKQEYLPKIKRSELWWCQGFSEPNSGSDLFSLQTTAHQDGGDFVINGSKIWTTRAHWADTMFAIVRTPDDGERSFSFILIDMKASGLTVRPIQTIDFCHHLNEVFFDNVRVPKSNLIGDVGQGRLIAKHLLVLERGNIQMADKLNVQLNNIQSVYREILQEDDWPNFQRKLSQTEVDLTAINTLGLRSEDEQTFSNSPALVNALKVLSTQLQQRLTELEIEMYGPHSIIAPVGNDGLKESAPNKPAQLAMLDFLFTRAASIYGGTTEVQKNIVFRMMN